MKTIDFGAFRRKMRMPSHGKILFRMLFGAFHGSPHISGKETVLNLKT